MSQNIYRHHWKCKSFRIHFLFRNIPFIAILRCQVLPESQSFCNQPCFLQFNKNYAFRTVVISYLCIEVQPEHRNISFSKSCIFMLFHFYSCHFLLQKSGKKNLCDTFIVHHELEHRIINRVCDISHNLCPPIDK